MDPNANLEETRKLVKELSKAFDDGEEIQSWKVSRLVELVEALDGWLSAGGAWPAQWVG